MKDVRSMKFLALGDSYTSGEGVDPIECWPVQLAARLRERGFMIADPVIIARTGWTTDELSRAIDQAAPIGPFDLVTLLIGVNNQYRGRPEAEYREQFAELLQRALALAGNDPAHVIVLSIPDWSVTPFAAKGADRSSIARVTAALDRFNAINRAEAERSGVRYIDVTPISRQAAHDRALLAGDDLHPSGKMYAEWVALIEPAAYEILRLSIRRR
jgi:lysophospholipase L1-like esterase